MMEGSMEYLEKALQDPSWAILIEDAISIIAERRRFRVIRGGFRVFREPPKITSLDMMWRRPYRGWGRYGIYLRIHGGGFKVVEETDLLTGSPPMYHRFTVLRSPEGIKYVLSLFYRLLEERIEDFRRGLISQKFTRFEAEIPLVEIRIRKAIWGMKSSLYTRPGGIRVLNIDMVGIARGWIAEVTSRRGLWMNICGPLPPEMTEFLSNALLRILGCKPLESERTLL